MHIGGLALIFAASLIVALAVSLATVVGRASFYREIVAREIASARFHSIDGLRGYLAVGVALHHIVINRQFYETGTWALTPSGLNTFIGRGSVAFFFMITAFLFWGRALRDQGRLDVAVFFASRVRRLVPMYFVAAGLLIITAMAFTHFRLNVPVWDLTRQLASWLLFTFPGAPDINGMSHTSLINTVFWSLVYEWKFYIVLPLLAASFAARRAWCAFLVAAACIALFSDYPVEWFFVAGCLAAHVAHHPIVRKAAMRPAASIVAAACVLTIARFQPMVYTLPGAAVLFVAFTIIAAGNSMFGLLTCRAARVLGLLSYSVYLLHNWVLFLCSRLVNHYLPISALPLEHYWALGLGVVTLTIGIAALTYRFVEYPTLTVRKPSGPVDSDAVRRVGWQRSEAR